MKREFTVDAVIENLTMLLENNEKVMRSYGWSEEKIINYGICLEEIFVNIASYAYTDGVGDVTIIEDISKDKISHTFIDSGIKYNPLERPDPDITLSAEERRIGGLGVYMVKKMMSEVDYKYIDGKNYFMMSLNRE